MASLAMSTTCGASALVGQRFRAGRAPDGEQPGRGGDADADGRSDEADAGAAGTVSVDSVDRCLRTSGTDHDEGVDRVAGKRLDRRQDFGGHSMDMTNPPS